MKTPIFIFLSAFAALFITGCATQNQTRHTTHTFNTVVIDPGHGGRDSGTHSHNGVKEKALTLATAYRLQKKLRAAGFRTVMTRKDDHYVSLEKRCQISNRYHNAIYISLHYNDAPRRSAHGILTFYRSPGSIEMANAIERSLTPLDNGLHYIRYANFHVLRDNKNPSVLVECGFLSNRREAARCCTSGYQGTLADSITDALIQLRKRGH